MKWVNAEAQELTATAQAEELRPIPDQDCARRAFFYAATKAFARWMDKVCDKDYPRRAFSDPATKAFAPRLGRSYADRTALDLADPEFGQPLFIAMAALAALAGQTIDAAEKALQWVLQRERRQWERRHSQEGLKRYQDLFAQAAALAVMVGGSENVPGLRRLAADVPLAQGVAVPDLDAVARILAELYPERGHLGVLRPSLLGEELALAELEREPGLVAAAFADARTPEQLVHAFTVLAQAASRRRTRVHLIEQALDHGGKRLLVPALEAAARLAEPLAGPLRKAWAGLSPEDQAAVAPELEWRLPRRTVVLADFALEVTKAALKHEALSRPERGRLLDNLSARLCSLGRYEEALQAIEEAVAIRRELAARNPDAFASDLARSLLVCARILRALGRWEEAFSRLEEALSILLRWA